MGSEQARFRAKRRDALPRPFAGPWETVEQSEEGWELGRSGYRSRIWNGWPEAHRREFPFIRSPFFPRVSAQDLLRLAWRRQRVYTRRSVVWDADGRTEKLAALCPWIREANRLCGLSEAEIEAELALYVLGEPGYLEHG